MGRPALHISPTTRAAEKIISRIHKNAWTRKRIAEAAGIDPSRFTRILKGESNPTLSEHLELSRIMPEVEAGDWFVEPKQELG